MTGRDEKTGQFLPGNKFWAARSSHGAKPKFETPEDLWSAAVEYFEWVDANPLYEDQLITFQGKATHEPVAKMRAMTMAGLWSFIDVHADTWGEWKRSRPDLSEVITRAESVVFQQKFEGAAAGLLNGSIIARDLGLSDRKEVSGAGGLPMAITVTRRIIDPKNLSEETRHELLKTATTAAG